ncbi:IclR family transcriptional regulator [Halorarum salinum]|uniref:IclR family transcriptional regulator n=1 Tax=Halorarum salinum TaxID=2743089 RepID=A0A7D5QI20_9EURY|nr:IclR family transcriptional regulator [Halobaculum salinum]QLG60285.1 IclR family transcriptional regulator [Halobaculum salinum]
MVQHGNSRRIQSVSNACEIIEVLRQTGGTTISEIDEEVSLSMGSIHTQLATLKDHGYIVQKGHKYCLGPELITLGEHVRNNTPVYAGGKDEIDELADKSGKTAFLVIEHKGLLFNVYESFGDKPFAPQYYQKKREIPHRHLHCTSSGKAILSKLPEERIEEIIKQHGLDSMTSETITDRETLLDELDETRERGYSLADGELIKAIRGVGVPVENDDRDVVGAVSVSAPREYMTGDDFYEETPKLVMKTASTIGMNIQTRTY